MIVSFSLAGTGFKLRQNNVWGISDDKGVMIINPKFDQLEYLSNGYMIVGRDGKFGLLNEQGVKHHSADL
jgi:hypothetical protein